jgi:predicted metalloprotease with PDZ domain
MNVRSKERRAQAMALAVLLVAAAGAAHGQPEAGTVRYTVAGIHSATGLEALQVEMHFTGNANGRTVLKLPEEWAGTDGLWRSISGLEAEGATRISEDGPARRVLRHPASAVLTVRYRVDSAYAVEPGFGFEKARPLVLPDWFFFHGEGVFAVVEGREQARAEFAWRDFPPSWRIVSDLDHLAGARPGLVRDVLESVALGAPDLELLESRRDGGTLRVATRGDWSFAIESFTGYLDRIVAAGDRLWDDPARPFVVVLAPLGGSASGLSLHGTGRGDGFAAAATRGLTLKDTLHFLAHEYLHSWIPAELGGHADQDDALNYWFSEGFTDYVAGRLLLAAEIRSLDEHLDYLNAVLTRYATSPARHADAELILARFWSDPDIGRVPYDRGQVFAYLVDQRVRHHSDGRHGLLDVLHRQRLEARNGNSPPAAGLFVDILRDEFGVDITEDVARYIVAGEQILLPGELFEGCATVTVDAATRVQSVTRQADPGSAACMNAFYRLAAQAHDPEGP